MIQRGSCRGGSATSIRVTATRQQPRTIPGPWAVWPQPPSSGSLEIIAETMPRRDRRTVSGSVTEAVPSRTGAERGSGWLPIVGDDYRQSGEDGGGSLEAYERAGPADHLLTRWRQTAPNWAGKSDNPLRRLADPIRFERTTFAFGGYIRGRLGG